MADEIFRTEEETKAIQILTEFTNATSFVDALNLRKDINRCVNFEEGIQWSLDDDVKDFPQITLNVVKQIGKVRKSGILQNEYGYLVNSSNFKSVRKIQDFLKYLANKMSLLAKDLKTVNDTYKKGTGLQYFYWNAEERDFLAKSGGKLKCEVIDIRRFRVADPYIQSVQDQEYVIFVSRERIDSIKYKYGKEVVPDSELYTNLTEKPIITDDVNKEFANVYTKFFRNYEGQVFFIISTGLSILKEATPLNPFYKGTSAVSKPVEAPNTTSLMDEVKLTKKQRIGKEIFNLYPFASLVFDERDNCFYGRPGAAEMLEAQKSINHHFSVYDKGIQDNVLGGFLMRRGILGEQELTTENGQTLQLDLLPGEDWRNVFGRIPVNAIPNDALNYSQNLMAVIKTTEGASNIQIGQSDYSGQSGKQTEMLLQRAKENTSDLAVIFNEFKKQQAYIMFLFAKFFYDNESFAIIEHGFRKDNVRAYMGEESEVKLGPEVAGSKFNGNEYLGDDVMIDIRVGSAPSFSEYTNLEMMGMAMQSGQVPPEVYVSLLPDGMISNREELIELMKNNSQKIIQALQEKIKQYEEIMKMMTDQYNKTKKDMANIDTVLSENERLKSMLSELAAKGIKIQQEASQKNQELTKDMTDVLNAINSMNQKKS